MVNTNELIKDVAIDIITVITVWGLFSNIDTQIDNKYIISPIYKTVFGLSISTYFIGKYL